MAQNMGPESIKQVCGAARQHTLKGRRLDVTGSKKHGSPTCQQARATTAARPLSCDEKSAHDAHWSTPNTALICLKAALWWSLPANLLYIRPRWRRTPLPSG